MIEDNLRTIGHAVLRASNGWDGLVIAQKAQPDLLIIDCELPDVLDFLILVRALRSLRRTSVLLLSVQRPSPCFQRKFAITDYIEKPFDAAVLVGKAKVLTPD